MTPNTTYDVVIVGASFAGLAVVSRLRGRVLLIDRKPIGEGQTSACATPVELVQRLAGPEAILQVHHLGLVHLSKACLKYRLPGPFCTFDYKCFCELVFRHTTAEFVQATALTTDAGSVVTSAGTFRGRCIVDASGWRAVLANSLDSSFRAKQRLAFGVESDVAARDEGLHFWLDEDGKKAYGWSFPCGDFNRVGWIGYQGSEGVKGRLKEFERSLEVERGEAHGGFLSWGMHEPVQQGVFLVGDSAGQCLPLTAEGIRTAVYFGQSCGDAIQDLLDGRLTKEQAIENYRKVVSRFRPVYRTMESIQRQLARWPMPAIGLVGRLYGLPLVSSLVLSRYLRAFPTSPVSSGKQGEAGLREVSQTEVG